MELADDADALELYPALPSTACSRRGASAATGAVDAVLSDAKDFRRQISASDQRQARRISRLGA